MFIQLINNYSLKDNNDGFVLPSMRKVFSNLGFQATKSEQQWYQCLQWYFMVHNHIHNYSQL